MRRLYLVLLVTIKLCGARAPGFSVHSDLVAYPQYEVIFSDGFISEKDAQALLESKAMHSTYSADFTQSTPGDTRDAEATENDGSNDATLYSYELMNMSPHHYLCSIPIINPPGPENHTANELAKAEEARELSSAATNGWELLNHLDRSCLYFMSGWWSYRFCNNREIVQFHAVTSMTNGQPPRRDPHTTEFILGRVPALPASSDVQSQSSPKSPPVPAELQVKGDQQRYLIQRLEGGTICDLTGRERTIEVQYHCVPGMTTDRIGWIKEVTICAYVMIVNTPRLCNNVAFLPPEETKANPISCQLINDGNDAAPPLLGQGIPMGRDGSDGMARDKTAEGAEPGKEAGKEPEVTVGGVVVGARHVLSGADEDGKPPVKLGTRRKNPLAGDVNGDGVVEVLAQAASKKNGGKITMLSVEELEKLDLKPEVVDEMKKQMEKIAGDLGWKLEIVETQGGDVRELRGYVDEDRTEGGDKETDADRGSGDKESGDEEIGDKESGDKESGDQESGDQESGDNKPSGGQDTDGKADDKNPGSEERFFKEEL